VRPRVVLAMASGLAPYAFGAGQLERLAAVADVLDPRPLTSFEGEDASALLGRCDVVLAHWGCPPLDEAVLSRAPGLQLVAYAAGTVRHLVTPAVWRKGIVVTSAAAANAVPVAEFTLAVILLANKGAFVQRERLRDPNLRLRLPARIGNVDKQVGIIGASHVGRHLIELLRPFTLIAVVTDPFLTENEARRLGVRSVELEELLRTSDIVTIHAPDLPTTRGMIGAPELAQLRDGVTLINTARPALVDDEALAAELATGRITAVLDVTEPEPLPPGAPLLSLPGAFVTPHIAGSGGTELARLADHAIDEIERFSRGDPLLSPVTEGDAGRIA
jgi:phosphoglycerate dehydrogenase-like enzyme